ncbi:MAG TPA: hypothetical protein VFL41_12230 [Gaiellaceae bacterium]|nr:hypothetical protein [Gaiellaceae bacterium]
MLIAHPVGRYWLEHCAGFEVDSPAGPLGVVREPLPKFETIVLQGGPAGLTLTLVPFEKVREVGPLERRLVVTKAPAPLVDSGRPVEAVGALAD